jgi:hypothetical protein
MNKLEKIHSEVDNLPQRQMKHPRRTKRLFGRLSPLAVILLAGSLVSGVLILTFLTYNLEMHGAVTLTGTSETSNILYDGERLTSASTEINTMDFSTVTAGEHLQKTHTIENQDGGTWDITFDLSQMPLEYVDTQDGWFGFQFYIQSEGVNITTLELAPATTETVTFHYVLDALFLETVNDFPFHVDITIEKQAELPPEEPPQTYSVGYEMNWIQFGNANIWSGIYSTNHLYDVIYTDNSTVIKTITYPTNSGQWTEVYNDIATIDYNDVLGSKHTGNDVNDRYTALVKDVSISEANKYTATMSIQFNTANSKGGLVVNFINSSDYWMVSLHKGQADASVGHLEHFINGVATSTTHFSQFCDANHNYKLEAQVDNTLDTIHVFVDSVDKGTFSLI